MASSSSHLRATHAEDRHRSICSGGGIGTRIGMIANREKVLIPIVAGCSWVPSSEACFGEGQGFISLQEVLHTFSWWTIRSLLTLTYVRTSTVPAPGLRFSPFSRSSGPGSGKRHPSRGGDASSSVVSSHQDSSATRWGSNSPRVRLRSLTAVLFPAPGDTTGPVPGDAV